MKNLDDKAKMAVIEELLKKIEGAEMDDMQSVKVSAPDKGGLLKGLDKAKEVLDDPNSSILEGEHHSAALEDDANEDYDEIERLEEKLKRLKANRR